MKANGREPKSCLGLVFKFKLGRFLMYAIVWHVQACLSLELETRPSFCPVSLSLSMLLENVRNNHNLFSKYFKHFMKQAHVKCQK